MQRIPIVENVFCHTHKQFHRILLSHVTVADPDSSDSSRLYPNTEPRVTSKSNSIPTKVLLSTHKEVFTSKNLLVFFNCTEYLIIKFKTQHLTLTTAWLSAYVDAY